MGHCGGARAVETVSVAGAGSDGGLGPSKSASKSLDAQPSLGTAVQANLAIRRLSTGAMAGDHTKLSGAGTGRPPKARTSATV